MPARARAGLGPFLVVTTIAASSCGYNAIATNGDVFRTNGPFVHDILREASLRSAAHDLPCPEQSVRVIGDQGSESGTTLATFIVEGCGEHVTYAVVTGQDGNFRCTLLSRVRVGPAPR